MANTLTGTELFTFGWFTTNAGKQTAEQMFTGGVWRGNTYTAGITAIEFFTDGLYVRSGYQQSGEILFSHGFYRGVVAGGVGSELIWAHILHAKERSGQGVPL